MNQQRDNLPTALTDFDETTFLGQMAALVDAYQYSDALAKIDDLPDELKTYPVLLERALVRGLLAVFGDGNANTRGVDRAGLMDAIAQLIAMREYGKDDVVWYRRLTYGYHILGNEEKAVAYALEWYLRGEQPEEALSIIIESRHSIDARLASKVINTFKRYPQAVYSYHFSLKIAASYEAMLSDSLSDNYGREIAHRTIEILKNVEEEGKDQPEWHHMITFPLRFLGRLHEAYKHALRWEALDPCDASHALVMDIYDDIACDEGKHP